MSEELHKGNERKSHESSLIVTALFVLTGLVIAITAFNQVQISDLSYSAAKLSTTGLVTQKTATAAQAAQISQAELQALAAKVIPRGTPKTYGAELKVSYDDPVASLNVLAPLDDATQLNKEQLERYIKITSQISCEYCCGAESIILTNGQAACGCQHSYSMRGLAKYLITKHGGEYTDDQILEELGKWKTLFFPKQILQKAIEFQTAGKDINTIDLTSNKYRGFKAQTATANVGNLPNMVGGC